MNGPAFQPSDAGWRKRMDSAAASADERGPRLSDWNTARGDYKVGAVPMGACGELHDSDLQNDVTYFVTSWRKGS